MELITYGLCLYRIRILTVDAQFSVVFCKRVSPLDYWNVETKVKGSITAFFIKSFTIASRHSLSLFTMYLFFQ